MASQLRARLNGALVAGTAFALDVVPAFGQITKIGKGEGQVDIVAWPGYIERGETTRTSIG